MQNDYRLLKISLPLHYFVFYFFICFFIVLNRICLSVFKCPYSKDYNHSMFSIAALCKPLSFCWKPFQCIFQHWQEGMKMHTKFSIMIILGQYQTCAVFQTDGYLRRKWWEEWTKWRHFVCGSMKTHHLWAHNYEAEMSTWTNRVAIKEIRVFDTFLPFLFQRTTNGHTRPQ